MHKLAYQKGTTLVHRIYPLTKFAWLVLGTGLVFILTDGYMLMVAAFTFLLVLILTYPTIWQVRGFRFTILTGSMLLLLYLTFDKSGRILVNPGVEILRITSGGLNNGLRFSSRFLAVVFLSYLFTLTTNPNHLAYTLMRTGLSYRFGFMLVTALRLAPILEEEGRTIYRAQLARGVRYDLSNLRKFPLLIQQFLTPLLIGALRHADKLFFSMEGRGFGKYKTRTFLERTSPSVLDVFVSIGLIIFFAMLLFLNFGGLI